MAYEGKALWIDGSIRIHRKDKLIEWLQQYPDDSWFELTISPIGDVNNNNQSKLYHKWCDIMARDLGWDSKAELHEYFKMTYNSGESTKGFDAKQWSEYMTKILAFAGENNFTLPTGNSD